MSDADELQIATPYAGPLAAKAWGDPALPPLLAVHGWLDNAASFDRIAPLLTRRRHVVAVDLRGHGRSAHLPDGAWPHYSDHFDDLHAVFDHFGWTRADLLGHSLGGTLLSLFAALHPERCGRLLLIEALGPLAAEAGEALPQLRRALAQRAEYGSRRALRVFADLALATKARMLANDLSETAARPLVERGTKPVAGGHVWSSDPRLRLASPQRYTEAQVLAMLDGIVAPTVLVLAEPATSHLPAAMMQARIARVAGIRVVRMAGNHHLHLEQPARVAAAFGALD